MTDTRLIERWLPIAALGEESVRERRFSMAGNVLPPNNSLHVWWARRPLIASRAAVLASLLPDTVDRAPWRGVGLVTSSRSPAGLAGFIRLPLRAA